MDAQTQEELALTDIAARLLAGNMVDEKGIDLAARTAVKLRERVRWHLVAANAPVKGEK